MAFAEYCAQETRYDQNPEQSALALQNEVTAWWNRLNGFAEADHEHHRAYGLAVGRVQSGKTRHYIGLILKALDAGYNTVIVLTSSNTTLAHQTMTRVYQSLLNNGVDFHTLTAYREYPYPHVDFTGNGNDNLFFPQAKYVGVVLKTVDGHLVELRNWIDHLTPDQLSRRRILVIDDEADIATQNGHAGQNAEPTAINQRLSDLFGRNGQCAYGRMVYASYTATPYACMYNENGEHNQLFPDCIRSMPVSNQYFGLERLFGIDVHVDECRMNVVRNVTRDELTHWIDPIKQQQLNLENEEGAVALTRTMVIADRERVFEWTTLKNAIQWAFCSAAARRVYRLNALGLNAQDAELNQRKHRWTTMLFNISQLTEVHGIQVNLIRRFLDDAMHDETSRQAFIDSCIGCWRSEVVEFTAGDFAQTCPGYGAINDYPTEDQIREQLCNWFCGRDGNDRSRYQVLQVNNQHHADMGAYEDVQLDGDRLWIVCGGNVLSRGLTLEGLTVSYFDRVGGGTPIDTITQMGRWFGYRQGYELLPRVWMDAASVLEIKRIARIEAQMHDSIREVQDKAERLVDADIPKVQYLGRRLSGRDAAGDVQNGMASYGVFSEVGRGTHQLAFEATYNFLYNHDGTPRYESVPRVQDELTFQRRHSDYWGGVPSMDVYDYLCGMRDVFRAGSLNRIDALLARLQQADSPTWEVVLGDADTNDLHDFGLQLGSRHCRSRTGEDLPDGAIRLSHMEFTQTAVLARKNIPNDLRQHPHGFSMSDVDMVFGALGADERHPVLLLDFVRDRVSDCVYIQPTFYWYGFSVGDYFGLMIGDGGNENNDQPQQQQQNHATWNLKYGGDLIAENIARFPKLVASVVRTYVDENPNVDIDALERQFHGDVWPQTRRFFVFDPENNQEIGDPTVYRCLRDTQNREVLVGGHSLYAYNQWRTDNRMRFLAIVRGLGFVVE